MITEFFFKSLYLQIWTKYKESKDSSLKEVFEKYVQ